MYCFKCVCDCEIICVSLCSFFLPAVEKTQLGNECLSMWRPRLSDSTEVICYFPCCSLV